MRPFFPFYGSKWNVARYYPPPRYAQVIEPFAGAAGYSTFYNMKDVLLFDKDPIIAGVWSYLIGASAKEIGSLPEMPNAGESVDDYALPQEAKWLIGFWLNRGSSSPKKSRTAYSARSDKGQLNWGEKAKERIVSQLPLLERWRVINASYEQAVDLDATWFIDPPYVEKGKYYRVKFNDFAALGAWTKSRCGQVMACEGPNADWLPFRPLGTFKTSKGKSQEFVYMQDAIETTVAA